MEIGYLLLDKVRNFLQEGVWLFSLGLGLGKTLQLRGKKTRQL